MEPAEADTATQEADGTEGEDIVELLQTVVEENKLLEQPSVKQQPQASSKPGAGKKNASNVPPVSAYEKIARQS